MRVKDFRLFTAGIDQRVSRFTLVERALYGGCSIYRSRASPGWCVAGIGIGVVALLIPLPRSIENGVDLFGIVVLVCVSVFVYLVYWKTAGEPGEGRFRFLIPIAAHFRQIVGRRVLGRAAVVSLLMIGLQAVSFWMVMPAFGLSLSLLSGIVIFFIVHIGTAFPNAPSFSCCQFHCGLSASSL